MVSSEKQQEDVNRDLPDLSWFCSSDLDEVLYPKRGHVSATQRHTHEAILNRNPCDFLDVLPLEMVLEIFKHLDIESLLNSVQTCRRWKHVIETSDCLWRWLCFNCHNFQEDIQRDLQEGYSWQAILQRCYQHHAIRRKWENGEFSNISSYAAIPDRSMTNLTQEDWGKILQLELYRGAED